jgi:hypothetical protein
MPTSHPKLLIVEGSDDLHSVVGLMRHHVAWPVPKEEAPVYIKVGGSADEILKEGYISALLKSSPIRILGIMLDADDNSSGRYQRIVDICKPLFPSIPKSLPPTGVIAQDSDGKRLGVGVMPDNVSAGFLEVFLRYLVPDQQQPLWKHAVQSVDGAKALAATCKTTHLPKAHLYTWLAWHDPPGRSPGLALTNKVLDPSAGFAQPFVSWFKSLYGL